MEWPSMIWPSSVLKQIGAVASGAQPGRPAVSEAQCSVAR